LEETLFYLNVVDCELVVNPMQKFHLG